MKRKWIWRCEDQPIRRRRVKVLAWLGCRCVVVGIGKLVGRKDRDEHQPPLLPIENLPARDSLTLFACQASPTPFSQFFPSISSIHHQPHHQPPNPNLTLSGFKIPSSNLSVRSTIQTSLRSLSARRYILLVFPS